MVISLVLTIALVVFLNYVAQKTRSMVVKIRSPCTIKTDVLSNGAILVSLVLIQVTGFELIGLHYGCGYFHLYHPFGVQIIKDGVYILLMHLWMKRLWKGLKISF